MADRVALPNAILLPVFTPTPIDAQRYDTHAVSTYFLDK